MTIERSWPKLKDPIGHGKQSLMKTATKRRNASESPIPEPVRIKVTESVQVSGLLQAPPGARAGYVLAHGAGAGMTHPFLTAVAEGLAARGITSLRYQFPYMEQGSKRPFRGCDLAKQCF